MARCSFRCHRMIPLHPASPQQLHGANSRDRPSLAQTASLAPPTTSAQTPTETSPFVDQSQTYASDPSHQVFLREYMIGADGKLHSTGALLGHPKADGTDGMATWGDLKANAAKFLGIN